MNPRKRPTLVSLLENPAGTDPITGEFDNEPSDQNEDGPDEFGQDTAIEAGFWGSPEDYVPEDQWSPLDPGDDIPADFPDIVDEPVNPTMSGEAEVQPHLPEGFEFDRFMDKILIQESAEIQRPHRRDADSLMRERANRHQDRPMNRTRYGVKR
jgi:hypothetical protein